ncbi:MAG: type II toxin-antitoxin system VapC family toxin [Longimicrobiales bacterium]
MRSTPAWVRTPADLSRYGGPLLLDTHIWVWRLKGETDRVTGDLMPLLDRSSSEGGVWVLDISYWEVAMKSAKGQLSFSVDPSVWLKRAREAPDIRPLRLDPDILLVSTRLAGTAHSDPADRMLIAAAQLNSLPLVTVDRRIIDYAKANPGTPVVDARRRGRTARRVTGLTARVH